MTDPKLIGVNDSGKIVGQSLTAVQAAAKPLVDAEIKKNTVRPGGRVIVLGDSIDEAPQGWFWYTAVMSKRMNVIRNAGIGGNTTEMMLARMDTDVLAYSPDIVILGGVTNDHGQGFTDDRIRGNIRELVRRVKESGATPVLRTTPPVSTAASAGLYTNVTARRQAVLRHNTWLMAWAASQGIPVLDIYPPLADANSGGYKPGLSSDGVHPTEAAHKLVADHLLSVGLPSLFLSSFALGRVSSDDSNLVANGNFNLDANSDGVGDSWGLAVNGDGSTKSLVSGGDSVAGNWQRLEITGAAVALTQDIQLTATDSAGQPKWGVGDVLEFYGRVRSSGTCPVQVRLQPYNQQGAGMGGAPTITPVYSLSKQIKDGVFSSRVTVPDGAVRLRVQVIVGTVGTPGPAGWAEFAEFAVRNITKLGV